MRTWIWRLLAAIAVLMLLFPPFQGAFGMGASTNRGYHFILSPPTIQEGASALATVNVPLLLTQYLALAIVALFIWLASRR